MGILNFLFGDSERDDYFDRKLERRIDHLERRCECLELKLNRIRRRWDDPRDTPPGSKDPYSVTKARLQYDNAERRFDSLKERFMEMDDLLERVRRMR